MTKPSPRGGVIVTEQDRPSAAERRRHHLHQQAADAMDTDAADTLLDHLPPAGWAWTELATKDDLKQSEAKMEREFAHQREHMKAIEARTDTKLEALEARISATVHKAIADQGRHNTYAIIAAVGAVSALPVLLDRFL